ncbi:MAG TPA: hypothetical protein VMA55_22790 [Acidovorax sp.]|nr:hypothetical protein [Acidovorax sp.]
MAAEQAKRRWWQGHGSTAVHEVIRNFGDMVVVATLDSRNGLRTYRGEALEMIGDRWTGGRLIDSPRGTAIHTKAVAEIIKEMTVLPDEEVRTIESRCRAYISAHKAEIAKLDQEDPALRAMAMLLDSCSWLSRGGSLSRKESQMGTQLEAHLRYLRGRITASQAA